MEPQPPSEPGNWATWVIHQVLHPFTVFITPALLLVLMVYLLGGAFERAFADGVRSLAGLLFPLVVVAFAFVFQRETLARLGSLPTVISFAVAVAVGVLVMVVFRLSGSVSVPLTELVTSGSFSLLVFTHATLRGTSVLSYYYGMISGMLLYVIVLGFPAAR